RLRQLIESILEYTGLQGARPLGQVGALDVAALAAEGTEELRPAAERKGLGLRATAGPAPPPPYTDPPLARLGGGHPLANARENGVKFTDHGEVEVTLTTAAGGVSLTVRDTGPGIPAEQQAMIFEPFEHLEPLSRKHTPGVGLGLTVVKELVQALGGRIEVE